MVGILRLVTWYGQPEAKDKCRRGKTRPSGEYRKGESMIRQVSAERGKRTSGKCKKGRVTYVESGQCRKGRVTYIS